MTYFLLVIGNLLVTLLGIVLAPVLPAFAVQKEWWLDNHSKRGVGPVLPSCLNWFMTPDNSLDGDSTFQAINSISYWAKVKWLWRNPAYSYALRYIDGNPVYWKGDKTIKDNDNAKEGWLYVNSCGLFQFVYIKRIFQTNRCIYCNFGWNIRVLVDDNVNPKPNPVQATFVFSPRISGFR